ncbi:hypothetical protein [uncultured Psychroserpens sp.]|uniref:hypothetical protein n=1 Tax=uncultured Psychroserpens sp. TaxID=255436 RepID=UPI0026181FF1|nr:hypothetical protein [uncultured Psychroserpens sp.]
MPSIPCPKCKTPLAFELPKVLDGKTFTCSSCQTVIAISYEDNKQSLDKATEALDKLKDELDID